jgi:hypothetical protein
MHEGATLVCVDGANLLNATGQSDDRGLGDRFVCFCHDGNLEGKKTKTTLFSGRDLNTGLFSWTQVKH